MSSLKEPRFWCSDLQNKSACFHSRNAGKRTPPYWVQVADRLKIVNAKGWRRPRYTFPIRDMQSYLALFEKGRYARYRGEASPDYLWSTIAQRRIREFSPKARILVMLRDPVDFLYSLHGELLSGRQGETCQRLETALLMEPLRRCGIFIPRSARYPSSLYYWRHCHFSNYIRTVYEIFPREQVRVMILDDLQNEPGRFLSELYCFLGLSDISYRQDWVVHNATKKQTPRNSVIVRLLRRMLRPEVEKLSQLLDRNLFGVWGYCDEAAGRTSAIVEEDRS